MITCTQAWRASQVCLATYSPREALASATGAYGSLGYSYDGVGNRLTQTTPAGTESYAYPSTSNRLAAVTSAAAPARTLSHDAAGNVIADTRGGQAWTYGYGAAGRLASATLNGVLQAEYKYDWLGRQFSRRLAPGNVTIHSVFGSDGQRISEYNEGTGALIRHYVWMGDRPVAVVEGGQVFFVRTDPIGRPVFATTSAGTQVWSASYLPFGGVHVSAGAPVDLRFPGQWFQTETGLHQNWMRDYDPTTGRYLEPDPLGLVDGASVYGYGRQSPLAYTDPTGQCPMCVAVAVGAAIGAGIDLGIQLYLNDWEVECVDWWQVGESAAAGAVLGGVGTKIGQFAWRGWEVKAGSNWRIAPFGNRTGHQYGKWPHYHRRGTGPGQGIGRHRPWEPKSTDTSWRDRF